MRKFLAFVLALFLAIPMLIGALMLISIRNWAVNRDFYKQTLTDDRLFTGFDAVPKSDTSETVEIGDYTFNSASLQTAVAASLPKDEIKKFASGSVDAVFDALEGKAGGAGVIDLGPLKASLQANSKKFAKAYVEGLPQGESASADTQDLSLLPKGISRATYASAIGASISEVLETTFEKADSKVDLGPVKASRAKMPFKRSLNASFTITMIGNLAFALALLFLAGIIWPKPWSARLPFMGGTLVFSSLIIIVIGVCGALAVNFQSVMKAMQIFGLPYDLAASGANAAAFKGYFASVAATMTRGFFITGIVAASVGAGLISMRWVAAAKEI